MSRDMILLLLCASTLLAAPQKDSNITLVKRQIESQPEDEQTSEELTTGEVGPTESSTVKEKPEEAEVEKQNEPTNTPLYNYSDRIYSTKTKPKNIENSTKSRLAVVESASTDRSTYVSIDDIWPLESVQAQTLVNGTVTYETDVTAADVTVSKNKEDFTTTTESAVETSKAPLAKILPKLSHYGKSTLSWFSDNLIFTTGKRKFRSKCRCEKIWNCAKLQISVPRCPEEYFLCCS